MSISECFPQHCFSSLERKHRNLDNSHHSSHSAGVRQPVTWQVPWSQLLSNQRVRTCAVFTGGKTRFSSRSPLPFSVSVSLSLSLPLSLSFLPCPAFSVCPFLLFVCLCLLQSLPVPSQWWHWSGPEPKDCLQLATKWHTMTVLWCQKENKPSGVWTTDVQVKPLRVRAKGLPRAQTARSYPSQVLPFTKPFAKF